MNITIENFDENRQKIESELDECDFCSIDCELSGITPYYSLNILETLEERYSKLKKNDNQYLILQIGLSFFKKEQNELLTSCYKAHSYNFFLFPRTENKKYSPKNDIRFQFQVSGVEFLGKHNFDFNKSLVKGISYLTKNHTMKMRKRIQETEENKTHIENELKTLENEAGFSNIMWRLSESKKLIIGHNMFVDTMFILRHFFSSQLPDSSDKFKSNLNSIFPNLVDTKFLASKEPFLSLKLSTTLNELHAGLSEKIPKVTFENEDYDKNSESKQLHDAAYDSYLTGCCYALMKEYLCNNEEFKSFNLKNYENKIYLMKINGYYYLDLIDEQETPSTENMFHVNFPKEWTRDDLNKMFDPFGKISVRWIDDYSAIVMLNETQDLFKARDELINSNKYKLVKVITYDEFITTQSKKIKT